MNTDLKNNGLLTLDDFRAFVADALHIPIDRLTPDASFINDLAVDSIRMVEMLLRIEELGISIPSDAAWNITTVRDAYDYYQTSVQPGASALGQV